MRAYLVGGNLSLPTNACSAILSRRTGTNVDLSEIVQAAVNLQAICRDEGHTNASIAIAPERADGVVVLNAFQAAYPQIVVFGKRYLDLRYEAFDASNSVVFNSAIGDKTPLSSSGVTNAATNVVTSPTAVTRPMKPASPEEMAEARAAMLKKIKELDTAEKDMRVHVVSTNTGPRFAVQNYLVMGNSVLKPEAIAATLTNIDGAFGTNVSFDGIRTAITELQTAYRERGYVTVSVGLPRQKLTNATVKVQVTEGRLEAITVKGNNYFSSNNVMRALPSLHTNMILNGLVFQAELNRANANQDRQIYPVVGPGPDPGTSELTLKVKDQLPLHAKVELNNESSPGTPDLRLNTSAVYNNLWQRENSLGLQYSFSPQEFKTVAPEISDLDKSGNQWNFYDRPLVANYSAFYRMPLGNPEPVEKIIADNPDNFGYNEATRKFNLPPPSGQPDLTVYGSRSTIDTGLALLSNQTFNFATTNGGSSTLNEKTLQQDLTVNGDVGFRLNVPIKSTSEMQSSLSGGLDYKTYSLTSYKTNLFYVNGVEADYNSLPPSYATNSSANASPVPITSSHVRYLPVALRYDETLRDGWGTTSLGLGLSANLWYDSSTEFPGGTNNTYGLKSLRGITGSQKSSGHWVILNPSLTRVINIYTNWPLTIRADGQWASEPLISNEQFGIGGVNSGRGYREGEIFGDTGWHVSLEQQTAPYVIGPAYKDAPLIVRGSVYMDCARAYLLDPQGRADGTSLWGVGFGGVASVGSHWQARLLFSLPLLETTTTQQYQPYFNFALTAQF